MHAYSWYSVGSVPSSGYGGASALLQYAARAADKLFTDGRGCSTSCREDRPQAHPATVPHLAIGFTSMCHATRHPIAHPDGDFVLASACPSAARPLTMRRRTFSTWHASTPFATASDDGTTQRDLCRRHVQVSLVATVPGCMDGRRDQVRRRAQGRRRAAHATGSSLREPSVDDSGTVSWQWRQRRR